MTTPTKKLAFTGLAAALVVFTPALAAERVAFKYNTAELRDAAAVEKLHNRLTRKAMRACGPEDVRYLADRQRCAKELADQWIAEIGDQRLAALHYSAS